MIKTNSILLFCITVFCINPVSITYAQEKLSQEPASIEQKGLNNPIVDTGQVRCFDNAREILCPKPGQPFYGQDAQYGGNVPSYRDNGDGTVTDLNTNLMWSKAVDKKKASLISDDGQFVCIENKPSEIPNKSIPGVRGKKEK